MKNFIKKLIQENKFFKVLYREINYITTVPRYIINYKIANPKIDYKNVENIIFIAHPDDEIVSMGNFLINNSEKMLVVCFTNGGNLTRLKEFRNAMNELNVKYQIWNFKDAIDVKWNEKKAIKKIKKILESRTKWNKVISHNREGDYGHFQHKQVYDLVNKVYANEKILVPERKNNLISENNKLSNIEAKKKKDFFRRHYKSQLHILNLYNDYFEYESIV